MERLVYLHFGDWFKMKSQIFLGTPSLKIANWPQCLFTHPGFISWLLQLFSVLLNSVCLLFFSSSSSILSISFHHSSRLNPPTKSKLMIKSDILKQLVWLVQLYCCNVVTSVCFIEYFTTAWNVAQPIRIKDWNYPFYKFIYKAFKCKKYVLSLKISQQDFWVTESCSQSVMCCRKVSYISCVYSIFSWWTAI